MAANEKEALLDAIRTAAATAGGARLTRQQFLRINRLVNVRLRISGKDLGAISGKLFVAAYFAHAAKLNPLGVVLPP